MTQSGIEPITLRLATQCLNQLRYRVTPRLTPISGKFSFHALFQACAAKYVRAGLFWVITQGVVVLLVS